MKNLTGILNKKVQKKNCSHRDLNPGHAGEKQLCIPLDHRNFHMMWCGKFDIFFTSHFYIICYINSDRFFHNAHWEMS